MCFLKKKKKKSPTSAISLCIFFSSENVFFWKCKMFMRFLFFFLLKMQNIYAVFIFFSSENAICLCVFISFIYFPKSAIYFLLFSFFFLLKTEYVPAFSSKKNSKGSDLLCIFHTKYFPSLKRSAISFCVWHLVINWKIKIK